MKTNLSLPTIDLDVLRSWDLLDSEEQGNFLRELIQLFLNTSPAILEQMKAFAAAGDFNALRRSAHKLKGSSANLGAAKLAFACSHLEDMPDGTPSVTWLESVAEIEACYTEAQQQFSREFLSIQT